MLFLVLSIICSVSVGIIFKISKRYETVATQIVMWNYAFALLFCQLFLNPDFSAVNTSTPWTVFVPLMLLLPAVFLLLATSIKHMGIVKTDAAQRLSLFIPLLAAWFIFKEEFNPIKLAGLAVGFPAILMILTKKDQNQNKKWIYPALVLLGFGVIDVLLKQLALQTKLPFTTSLPIIFFGAMVVMLLTVLFELFFKKQKLGIINLAFGALVGIFNFSNIYFYIKAHQHFSENPSTVFAAMNMGVIVLGSLAGILIFKERLSKLNYFGLLLALAAIVLITLSQILK